MSEHSTSTGSRLAGLRRRVALPVAVLVMSTGCFGGGDPARAVDAADVEQVFPHISAQTLSDADELNRRFEEAVADCMRQEGFSYEPHYTTHPRFEGRSEYLSLSEPPPGADLVAHAREVGYGFTLSQRVLDIEWAAREEWAYRNPDPNEQTRSRLSDHELEAYYLAMYGPRGDDPGESTHPWPPADPTAGCVGQATLLVRPTQGLSDRAQQELSQLHHTIDQDPAVVGALGEWRVCMAERGRPAQSPLELRNQVQQEVVGMLPVTVEGGPEDDVLVEIGGERFHVSVRRHPADIVERMLAVETEVAVVDAECDVAVGLTETRRATELRVREEFVERYWGELVEGGYVQ